MSREPADLVVERADLEACRARLRAGSKSFSAAASILPRRVREPATVLYAFCRVADDEVDLDPSAGAATIDRLRARLDRVYAGHPDDDAVDRALSVVVARERVPRALLDALLEGMAWDAEGRRYETLEDLYAYAARVAGAVGAMMTVLMGRREPDVIARACDLGVAMQLTNIARDVGEDARNGRLYLPLVWLREAGIDPARWLLGPVHDRALGSVVERLLDAAELLYHRADAGVAWLPADCRAAIRAARLIYADIGRAVRAAGFDAVTRRAVVTTPRKVWLLAQAFATRNAGSQGCALPPLGPTRFLVAACAEGA
jgi:15-cis-phytoene synthase